jgi:hypothetical protein
MTVENYQQTKSDNEKAESAGDRANPSRIALAWIPLSGNPGKAHRGGKQHDD